MNNYLNQFLIAGLSLLLLAGCNSDNKTEHKEDSAEHQHIYACPMHPEVTGKEGDTCPKCGMKLEHSDAAAPSAGTYFMQFAANPAAIQPGQDAILSFTPKKKSDESGQVALEVQHEKKIHLIIVSDDLSWFDHIHPDYTDKGSYDVKTRFPAPGKYKAFADYKPAGSGNVVDKIEIDVAGQAPAVKKFTTDKLSGNSANYSFEMKPTGGKLITGALLHISGIVRKDGKEIDANSLENYLGAKAHFVLISLNEKEFLHVHPEVSNGQFDLHTTIEKPGLYRGWVQFNADGKIHTIDFTMNVVPGTAADVKNANQSHTEHHTGKPADDHANH